MKSFKEYININENKYDEAIEAKRDLIETYLNDFNIISADNVLKVDKNGSNYSLKLYNTATNKFIYFGSNHFDAKADAFMIYLDGIISTFQQFKFKFHA